MKAIAKTIAGIVATVSLAGQPDLHRHRSNSSDLGLADPWTNHEAAVPDADATVNGVVFDTTDDGDYIQLTAVIPTPGSAKLFACLSAVSAP
jgi:hypothetical protein